MCDLVKLCHQTDLDQYEKQTLIDSLKEIRPSLIFSNSDIVSMPFEDAGRKFSRLLLDVNSFRLNNMFEKDFKTFVYEMALFHYKFKRAPSLYDFHLFFDINYSDRMKFLYAVENSLYSINIFDFLSIVFEFKFRIFRKFNECANFDVFVRENFSSFVRYFPKYGNYNMKAVKECFCSSYPIEYKNFSFEYCEKVEDFSFNVVDISEFSDFYKDISYENLSFEEVIDADDLIQLFLEIHDSLVVEKNFKNEQCVDENKILQPHRFEQILVEYEYDLVLYAPPGYGKSTFNKNVFYDSDFVSQFNYKPKILMTNFPSLIKKGKYSIALISSFEVFVARIGMKCGHGHPFKDWYKDILQDVKYATKLICSDLFLSDALRCSVGVG